MNNEDAIKLAFRGGMSVGEIVARSGCTHALVRTVLGDAGLLPRRHGRRWPYDARTEALVASEYGRGVTMPEIVTRFGGNHRSIRQVLERRGVPVRASGRPRRGAGPARGPARPEARTG